MSCLELDDAEACITAPIGVDQVLNGGKNLLCYRVISRPLQLLEHESPRHRAKPLIVSTISLERKCKIQLLP